jgi:hypothetical protein
VDQSRGTIGMERVYLVEFGSAENCHEDLAILTDSQIFNPSIVGKLVNVAGGESCASIGT